LDEVKIKNAGASICYDQDELNGVAEYLVEAAGKLKVWMLFGEMGVGKTTLIKAITKQLGVKEVVQSPTFSIVNEYSGGKIKIFHFDFYRIKNEEEAFDIGVDEYFDSGQFCFVEWPEKIPSLVPCQFFEIRIVPVAERVRKLECKRYE
jgi:tRNA threonylcarbamoyladenosine biosynthesis protein TsaE